MASQTVNKKNREILQNGKKNLNNLNETKICSNINNGSGNNEQNY
jgi:hypothetical protein